ncbi:MAG: pyrroline-5-carboxylate reductase [Deltaproteobacteria bacterium]|nr:pyrroline-5-carboxylate reductase [Deltaproteobacteria bacterium]
MAGRLGIIGTGNMGEAITRGVLQSALLKAEDILVTDVSIHRLEHMRSQYQVKTVTEPARLVEEVETIILAVKPQSMDTLLSALKDLLRSDVLIVSIAAGVSLEKIARGMPPGTRVVRVMPNNPALYMKGIAALCPGKTATGDDMKTVSSIFEALGRVVVVEEKMMDAVTGLSGSGPAYVYLFIEALSDGGVRMGLPRDVATELAVQTVLGSAVVAAESRKHVALLKEMVTSPGGTTIAGLHELERGAFRGVVINAVEAATKRSRELGKEY